MWHYRAKFKASANTKNWFRNKVEVRANTKRAISVLL